MNYQDQFKYVQFFMFVFIYAIIAGLLYGFIDSQEIESTYLFGIEFSFKFFFYILFITPIFFLFLQNKIKINGCN